LNLYEGEVIEGPGIAGGVASACQCQEA
jgi:hypothetical protein